ncbi:hypothetical protein [Falsiroseomonas tokyonensis]|uniref:VanZ-like domain-containing protein n=1 Tax=Falsiroseomonas tokyonensis TaxID=430521 RepID=A0ABV7C5G8_9PROT|nr:hypothetical protein [Falsiroseomonas tokyonensis]MBU8541928.1 hypothetical protein [Falsiroseomonas tokyonensis]
MQATSKGRAIAWFLLVVLGVANVAGYAFDLYQRFWWFDRILHGCTILAVTLWLALFVFGPVIEGGRGRSFLAVLLLASVGIALGALWEVAEWGFDQIAPGDVIKGKHDTIIDIVMDTAGALLAGILALWLARWPPGTGGESR